jgi:hypothetical protein
MTYTTYYLKFSSQEEAEAKLDEAGYKVTSTTPDSNELTTYRVTDQVGDIDIVGEIYNNDGAFEINEEGYPEVLSPATKKEGWHVNIILEGSLPPSLEEYALLPRNPHRIFA